MIGYAHSKTMLRPCREFVLAILLLLAILGGCNSPKDASRVDETDATQPSATASSQEPASTGPRTLSEEPSLPPVTAKPVRGWQIVEAPVPGVLYQYVRETHEQPFRPSVTIVVDPARATDLGEYAQKACDALAQQLEGFVLISNEELSSNGAPLRKVVFQHTRQDQTLQVMQLLFLRNSGEVVVVSFQATTGQWEFLQYEFKQILSAITVNP